MPRGSVTEGLRAQIANERDWKKFAAEQPTPATDDVVAIEKMAARLDRIIERGLEPREDELARRIVHSLRSLGERMDIQSTETIPERAERLFTREYHRRWRLDPDVAQAEAQRAKRNREKGTPFERRGVLTRLEKSMAPR